MNDIETFVTENLKIYVRLAVWSGVHVSAKWCEEGSNNNQLQICQHGLARKNCWGHAEEFERKTLGGDHTFTYSTLYLHTPKCTYSTLFLHNFPPYSTLFHSVEKTHLVTVPTSILSFFLSFRRGEYQFSYLTPWTYPTLSHQYLSPKTTLCRRYQMLGNLYHSNLHIQCTFICWQCAREPRCKQVLLHTSSPN